MATTGFFDQVIGSIGFPFKGSQWGKKLLIGALIGLANSIIPILPVLIITGYCGKIMKQIIQEGEEPYLPDWDDWGGYLGEGLKLWGAGIIYSLPLIILLLAAVAGMILSGLLIGFSSNSSYDSNSISPGLMALPMLFIPIAFGLLCSAAFRFKEWWPILKAGFSAYLIIVLASFLLSFIGITVIQLLNSTIILCFLYPLTIGVFTFLLSLYQYTFWALAYREGRRRLKEPA
jgi:hypothetical protein